MDSLALTLTVNQKPANDALAKHASHHSASEQQRKLLIVCSAWYDPH